MLPALAKCVQLLHVIDFGDRGSISSSGIPSGATALGRGAIAGEVTPGMRSLWNFAPTAAREKVDEDGALCIDTVFACVNVLSQAIASLPLDLYRSTRRGGVETRVKARNHRLHSIANKRPHAEFTSFRWRQHMVVQLLIRGNSITQILRDDAERIVGLYPLLWERCTLRRRESGELVYLYSPNTRGGTKREQIPLMASEVVHVRGISNTGGLVGMSVIEAQREALGVTKAVEKHGGKTFANGASPSGVLEVPETLSDAAFERLRESWKMMHEGAENAGRTAILEGGTKFAAMSMSNEDAQFLETRKFQRAQIASFFRVPPHFINDLERATFSNIEHQDLAFVKHTLLPWLINIEQELDTALLNDREVNSYYFRHNVSALERGDFVSRTSGLQALVNSAIMTPNEARAKEELNAHEDGDVLLGNGTLTPVRRMGEMAPAPAPPTNNVNDDEDNGT